jgi:hypothetical protein
MMVKLGLLVLMSGFVLALNPVCCRTKPTGTKWRLVQQPILLETGAYPTMHASASADLVLLGYLLMACGFITVHSVLVLFGI